jgi:hypothetical protein
MCPLTGRGNRRYRTQLGVGGHRLGASTAELVPLRPGSPPVWARCPHCGGTIDKETLKLALIGRIERLLKEGDRERLATIRALFPEDDAERADPWRTAETPKTCEIPRATYVAIRALARAAGVTIVSMVREAVRECVESGEVGEGSRGDKRARVVRVLSLPDDLRERLDALCRANIVSVPSGIRYALQAYVSRRQCNAPQAPVITHGPAGHGDALEPR